MHEISVYKITLLLKKSKTENAISTLHIVVKGKFIVHILSSNCPLKHVPEGKIEKTGTRGRRCKQLLDDIKEKRRY
jgi:hypothetical protein